MYLSVYKPSSLNKEFTDNSSVRADNIVFIMYILIRIYVIKIASNFVF